MKLHDEWRWLRSALLAALLATPLATGTAFASVEADSDAGSENGAAELIDWVDLMPADWEPKMPDLSSFFHDPQATGFSQDAGAPVVQELHGRHVSIEGWLVPLDWDSDQHREFLLVPYFGACLHVPPPPSNQIVHVRMDAGLTEEEMWDPQRVTGTLRVEGAVTDLAQAGYRMERATTTIADW